MRIGEKHKVEVSIRVKLYPADLEMLLRKVTGDGIKFDELIECFLGDLAGGDARTGSDESSLAGSWYDRHAFELGVENGFLRYLANEYLDIDDLFMTITMLDADMDLLTDYYEEGYTADEEIKDIKTEITTFFAELATVYAWYSRDVSGDENFKDAMKSIWTYGWRKKKYLGYCDGALPSMSEEMIHCMSEKGDTIAEIIRKDENDYDSVFECLFTAN